MRSRSVPHLLLPLAALLPCLLPRPVHALDKQGSAHGGAVETAATGFNISGGHFLGVALYNPGYAARPDNTGRALFRYGSHMDVDLLGQRLSVPLDLNFFTDAEAPDLAKLQPSEFDVIAGLTTTWRLGPGSLEGGVRFEHDRPVDRGTFTQTYLDARARYLYSFADLWPRLGLALLDGDVSGWLTLGVFAWNPTYAARPDNTGLALMRYGVHVELSFWHDRISFGGDATMFSDREAGGGAVLRPSELDVTAEVIGKLRNVELHVAYERDLPLDRPGLVQSFVYLLGVWAFDLRLSQPRPLEYRGQIVSP